MLKTVLAGTAALVIAGSSLVYAQQGSDGDHHWRPSAADFAAFTDARVAALKAGLKLTPDQEKNWPAFEQAFRDLAKMRADRMQARMARMAEHKDGDHADNVDPVDRLERRADALSARGTALKHLADAAKPLYQSLDDGQKHRFIMLARVMHREHHEHFAGRFEHEHGHEHGDQQ